jgi:hypothetical protein
MAEDKLIKTGQLTLTRLVFLALCGVLLFAFVALGGKFLSVGYMLVTLAICLLLFLIATDYGVQMDKVDTNAKVAATVTEPGLAAPLVSASTESKIKRRVQKTVKRRR